MTRKLRSMIVTLVLASLAACGKGDSKLGVAECDAYLDKMAACAKKLGGAEGQQLTRMRDMMSRAWHEEVKNEEMRASMPSVCTTAIADMKKQVPSCDW